MKKAGQNLKQSEKEEFESSRMCDEEIEDVKVFQDRSSSSSVVVPTAGKVENEDGDDGEGLVVNNPLVVMEPVLPVDTLLEEIGLIIFGMLSDEDVANCSRTYPKWQQWLMNQRTRFLFPEVVPLLLKHLPKYALLDCREVCRSWRDGLDNNPYPAQAYSEDKSIMQNDTISVLASRLDSSNKISSFLEDMESHPGNPFPGRSLILEWDFPKHPDAEENDDGDLDYLSPLFEDYWNNSVIQLLDVFGHQVHFVCIDFDNLDQFEQDSPIGPPDHSRNFTQIVQRVLERLPNLKKLQICGNMYDSWARDIEEEETRRMRMLRLPQLANLESVGILSPPVYFIQSILESYCDPNKIKRVYLYGDRLAEAVYGFQNLEVLSLHIILEDLERFLALERRPPLRRVDLSFSYGQSVDWRRFTAFQQLFAILELFASTLKDVDVSSRDRSGREGLTLNSDSKSFRINLPKLERFSWSDYVGPLDPFIQLPSLKNLDLNFNKMLPWDGSAVQLYGFEERMENSNIWSLIPSLMTLKIEGTNHLGSFRKSYDRRMLEQNWKEMEKSQEGKPSSDIGFH